MVLVMSNNYVKLYMNMITSKCVQNFIKNTYIIKLCIKIIFIQANL